MLWKGKVYACIGTRGCLESVRAPGGASWEFTKGSECAERGRGDLQHKSAKQCEAMDCSRSSLSQTHTQSTSIDRCWFCNGRSWCGISHLNLHAGLRGRVGRQIVSGNHRPRRCILTARRCHWGHRRRVYYCSHKIIVFFMIIQFIN